MGHDDVVDEAVLSGDEGIGEFGPVFRLFLRQLLRIVAVAAEDDLHRAFRAHDRDFGGRPGIVHVTAQMLGRHDVIGAAIGLAGDDRDLRHRRLGIGVEQLGAVLDDPAIFLGRAGQEAGDVDQGHDRDIERVAEAHETAGLDRAGNVQAAGQNHGLVGDDTDRVAFDPCEADDDIRRIVRLQFEEVALVRDLVDQFLDIVGLVRIRRHQRVQGQVRAVDRIVRRPMRRLFLVVQWQEAQETAQLQDRLDIVFEGQIRDAGFRRMGRRTTQLLGGHRLIGDGFHDFRSGHEHVGRILDHEDKVGHGGRVDRAAGTGPHDHGNLRHDTGGQDVALKHIGISGQRGDAFLNPRAAGIVQADDRDADLHRLVHDLADLAGMGGGQRAAEDGEVLGEDEDPAAVHQAVPGDDAVARHPVFVHAEIGAVMFDEHVPFFEGPFVQQQIQPLPRRQFALTVLGVDPGLAAAHPGPGAHVLQALKNVLHGNPPA